MLIPFIPCNKSYLHICMAILFASQTAQAAWLKTYGTSKEDSYLTVQAFDKGGYTISGQTGNTQWYGLLDAQGNVLWTKTSGNARVYINPDASVGIFELRNLGTEIDPDYVSINATGKLNANDGAISNISVQKNIKITGNDGQLFGGISDNHTIQGRWLTSDTNTDVAFAKLDANNKILWSHLYDSDDTDFGAIKPFGSGYLLSLSSYELDPQTYDFTWIETLSKLDANGNILAGSSKKITNITGYLYSQPQDDGSVFVIGHSDKDISLIKLDSNLNFVWGKRYFSNNDADHINFYYPDQKTSNGVFELHGAFRERYDENNKLIEKHPLLIKINADNGSIVTKKEVQINQFDFNPFSTPITGKYVLDGITSNTFSETYEPKADDDGLFALFSNSLQPEWVRTIAGDGYDRVDSLETIAAAGGYLLSGTTESWGAGGADQMLGRLDKNGTVANCSAIQTINATVLEADLAAEDIPSPVSNAADPSDNGAFTVTVDEQQYSVEINPTDYPITVTDICTAADPVPTPAISLSAAALDFGAVEVKKTANLDMTITNNGDGPLNITSFSAPTNSFSKTSDSCTGKNIAAGNSCKISYKFAPTSGGSFSDTVTIKSNDSVNNLISFDLKGTGSSIYPPLTVQSLSSTDLGAGNQVTLTGQGFTSKKGKIKIGAKTAKIVSWTDSSIVIKLPTLKAATYPVTVITKKNGSVEAGPVTLHTPEVASLDINSGPKNTVVTVTGQYFGSVKPKVYLISGKKRKVIRVLPGNTDDSLTVRIPKLKPADYYVLVKNSVGKSTSQTIFTVQ